MDISTRTIGISLSSFANRLRPLVFPRDGVLKSAKPDHLSIRETTIFPHCALPNM
jgi:hypothetical protein